MQPQARGGVTSTSATEAAPGIWDPFKPQGFNIFMGCIFGGLFLALFSGILAYTNSKDTWDLFKTHGFNMVINDDLTVAINMSQIFYSLKFLWLWATSYVTHAVNFLCSAATFFAVVTQFFNNIDSIMGRLRAIPQPLNR
eukprot:TRINITY_DN945_c0_g1_i4.p1 TRINITY_DN945_c0_g1~~TRINITY_DN945_c0_g1_i4.p1  ORF type:complete len:140 (+),score=18.89 TRINITY_DN945_c0_g1_i4:1241-1660(+)